jgi:hypothetical protein
MSVADEKYGDDSFEAIEAAVLKTPKGRWFLEEYARRIRSSETTSILEAIGRLERAVAPPAAQPALKPNQLKYFKQDEEIFVEAKVEPPTLTVVEKSEPKPAPPEPKGATLRIERAGAPATETSASQPASEPMEQKQRVVIIRKPAGEDLTIPLVDHASA